jgi:hypothetical protein
MSVAATDIREHMEVVGSDGKHVGTVDSVEGSRIKLTKSDPAAGGEHHYLHLDVVDSVGDRVTLNRTAEQAQDEWGVESVGGGEARGGAPGSSRSGP